jgi:membrane associated rhomboid family serine protease
VLGAYFLTYPQARVLTLVPIVFFIYLIELPAYFFLGFWFVMQFIQGSLHSLNSTTEGTGGIAFWAHVGGFVAGVLLLGLFRQKDWQRPIFRAEKRIRRYRR